MEALLYGFVHEDHLIKEVFVSVTEPDRLKVEALLYGFVHEDHLIKEKWRHCYMDMSPRSLDQRKVEALKSGICLIKN